MFSGTREGNASMSNGTEKTVAVAATAYVIHTLEGGSSSNNESLQPKRINDRTVSILETGTRSTSKTVKDRRISIQEQDTTSGPYSGKGSSPNLKHKDAVAEQESRGDDIHPFPLKKTKRTELDNRPAKSQEPPLTPAKPVAQGKQPQVPTIKDPRTVPKPQFPTTRPPREVPKPDLPTTKQGIARTKPDTASSLKPVEQAVETDQKHRPISIEAAEVADDWEKAEMAKIREWFESLSWTISSWEDKQKTKARHKLDRTEEESDPRGRAKATQKYKSDMEYIDQVVRGARAEAEEKQRKKERRVKEKANQIRTTGKVPMTCFCF